MSFFNRQGLAAAAAVGLAAVLCSCSANKALQASRCTIVESEPSIALSATKETPQPGRASRETIVGKTAENLGAGNDVELDLTFSRNTARLNPTGLVLLAQQIEEKVGENSDAGNLYVHNINGEVFCDLGNGDRSR